MRQSLTAVLALVFVFIFSAQPAQAGRHGRHGDKGDGKMWRQHFEKLNLTEEQRTQLGEVRKKKIEGLKGIRKQSKDARKAFYDKLKADAPEAEIRAANAELRKLKSQKEDARFENMLAVRNILTPEQRKEYMALVQKTYSDFDKKWKKHEDKDEANEE
jgi:periplasmic protein CpxP/Spy